MTRTLCAPGLSFRTFTAALLCSLAMSAGERALADDPPAASGEGTNLYQCVKSFDFNERVIGNYEDTPMYWQRLTGEGLPPYSAGRFDDELGHAVAPSFRFGLRGGSCAYEYTGSDLGVSPGCDYLLEGYIRVRNLRYARAFIAAFLLNERGERIAGTERVSQTVRSGDGVLDGGEWQRVAIDLHVDDATARALGLQLWVLQGESDTANEGVTIDPVVRQDVDATVWFDDLALVRMPRVRMQFSNPGGLVHAGAAAHIVIDVQNSAPAALNAVLRIHNEIGERALETELDCPAHGAETFHVPVPELVPGTYRAEVCVSSASQLVLAREIRFAVLPKLSVDGAEGAAPRRAVATGTGLIFGVDLAAGPDGYPDGAAELIKALGCGAVRLGLPLAGPERVAQAEVTYLAARDLANQLALRGVGVTGVLLAPDAVPSGRRLSTYRLLTGTSDWNSPLGALFACFASRGGRIGTWQLGDEATELCAPERWNAAALADVRDQLERFLGIPQLVIPRSVLDAPPTTALVDAPESGDRGPAPEDAEDWPESAAPSQRPYAFVFWVPAEVPTRALPWQLAFWFAAPADAGGETASPALRPPAVRWLSLARADSAYGSADDRRIDLARRVVLASVVNPGALYVPAPFELDAGGGAPAWAPTDEFVALRTLFAHLSGRRAAATLGLPGDSVAVLFQGEPRNTMIVWTWQRTAERMTARMHVGADVRAWSLAGEEVPLTHDGPWAEVPLKASPVILENVDVPLLLLQQSFEVSPALIQIHEPEPRPELHLRNPYLTDLVGRIELEVPPNWQIAPNPIPLELAPGESLAQPLILKLPERQVEAEYELRARLHLRRPSPTELDLSAPVRVALHGITLHASAWFEGDDLLVRQVLGNRTELPVSFRAYCQAPEHPLQEAAFVAVPSGETRAQTYRLPAARALAGRRVVAGIDEIGGRRTLSQLVDVPRE